MRTRFSGLCSVAAIAATMVSSGAFAQAEAEPAGGIKDIVVTAEKRESTVQKSALSLSVVNAEALRSNGVGNLQDLSAVTPSVSFVTSGAATIVAIRGVSSRDTSEIGDPAVSVSIDGFNLQRAIGLNSTLFDLDRVEALRGPQGTLLGRNATGGALNIITAKPKDDFAAYVSGEVGSYSMFNTSGMLNLPVAEGFKIRASFQTRDRQGYRNNAPGPRGDDEDSKAGRVHLLFEPTARWDVLLTGEYASNNSVGPVIQAIPLNTYTATTATAPFIAGDPILSRPTIPGDGEQFAQPAGGYLRTKNWNFRWTTNYDLDFATLTYTGGYRDFKFDNVRTLGGLYGTRRQNFTFSALENPKSWNHEVRLTSKGDSAFNYTLGGFYFREKNNLISQFRDYSTGGVPASSLTGTPFLIQDYRYPDLLAVAKAVFGQVSYEIVDGLKVEAGARYSKDNKRRTGFNVQTNLNTYVTTNCTAATCVFVTNPQNSRVASKKTTFHAAVNYEFTPRNMVYAKFDTGYKAGGFTDLGTYGPESVEAFEIGSKNRFLDNKLQVNISAFHYKYTDQQVSQVAQLASGNVATLILNAGESSYKGVELDIVAQPTPEDRLNFYVGYLDAKYKDFSIGAGAPTSLLGRIAISQGRYTALSPTTGNWQLAGNRPPQAPKWSINAGYEHSFGLFGGEFTPRVQTHYETASYFLFQNFASDRQKAFLRSDVLVTFQPASKAWTLQGYVRNISDKLILAGAQDPTSGTYLSYRYQYQAPRTYGASLRFDF